MKNQKAIAIQAELATEDSLQQGSLIQQLQKAFYVYNITFQTIFMSILIKIQMHRK